MTLDAPGVVPSRRASSRTLYKSLRQVAPDAPDARRASAGARHVAAGAGTGTGAVFLPFLFHAPFR